MLSIFVSYYQIYNKVNYMRKTNHQNHYRQHNLKHQELTPKILAKSPLAYKQRKLAGQSSALPTKRFKQQETNIFKSQKPSSPFQSPSKDKPIISEQLIKNSSIFKSLEQQLLALIKRQQSEFQKLDELKSSKEIQIKQVKMEQHAIKLEIWQLRNETLGLKENIQVGQEQNERLMQELGITEEDFQIHNQEDEEQPNENSQLNEDGQNIGVE